jgi:hypothetical protein
MALSFTEIDSLHAELLPARTVMSLFTVGEGGSINGKGGAGGSGQGGSSLSCLISIGNASVGLGAILGSGAADGNGTSCSSFGNGGHGGAGVATGN